MKLILVMSLFLPLAVSATQLSCTSADLIYGNVTSIVIENESSSTKKTIRVEYQYGAKSNEDVGQLNPSIAGGLTYVTQNGVMITVPVTTDLSQELKVGLSTYDFPYEIAHCRENIVQSSL